MLFFYKHSVTPVFFIGPGWLLILVAHIFSGVSAVIIIIVIIIIIIIII